MKLRLLAVILTCPLLAYPQKKAPQQREVKIQKTSLTREQEAQLGKEAAAEVEKTMEVLRNPQAEAWLNQIGQRLAKTPQANAYPYYFKLVNDDSINAFALPGGPMFVHTGLIKAAASEAQVAGVLAHEMSHIALRHGASQMSKAQTWQTIMGVVGAAAGMTGSGGQCGLLCQAVQIGGGLGANTVLSKFSRDHERDADLNGARMMAAAGYNPIELARFFEKLEAQMGTAGEPKGLAAWTASHPATGSRVQYVSEDITFYPRQDYNFNTGNFDSTRRIVASLPPPKKKPAALLQPVQPKPRQGLPAGFQDLQTQGFAIAFPVGWQTGQGGGLYAVPKGGAVQSAHGGIELIAGALIDYYTPAAGKADLPASTRELLSSLTKSDASLRIESTQQAEVGGKPARVTTMMGRTSNQQEPEQVVYLYTVVRGDLLWNLALATPPSQRAQLDPVFQQILSTVRFVD